LWGDARKTTGGACRPGKISGRKKGNVKNGKRSKRPGTAREKTRSEEAADSVDVDRYKGDYAGKTMGR